MNDTMVTLVGNVATAVEYRDTMAGAVARFRFAVTARRWDRERASWSDGPTSFYTVSAWRTLGANLAASVAVGEPLVVHGRLKVREDERDGQRKTFVDVDAFAVGHDLTRGTSAFRRTVRAEPRAGAGAEPGAEPGPGAGRGTEPGGGGGELTGHEARTGGAGGDTSGTGGAAGKRRDGRGVRGGRGVSEAVEDPWTAAAHQLVTAP
ncbi:single-stranded DNA-binding protein [Streptomyces termitum]|uniref:single-stranded DNA-binding protein n=1 Tax=Streptomyces termitum TaxID=67368 RepID=UPI001E5A6C31|nr:single-stranded DNA-binding protein [Streptomyces termitum]